EAVAAARRCACRRRKGRPRRRRTTRGESACPDAKVARMVAARLLVLVAALTVLSACNTLGYLAQAGAGQDEILTKSRDSDELLRERRRGRRGRRLVAEVAEMKRFGEANGLRPTSNYTKYARLDRSAAVWVVSACEPLRFRSKVWWFPIVGSITYTGWF